MSKFFNLFKSQKKIIESEQKVEEEKISIKVTGDYTYDIIKDNHEEIYYGNNRVRHSFEYYKANVKYKASVEFLGESINIDSVFTLFHGNEYPYGHSEILEEEIYEEILKDIEGGNKILMDSLSKNIIYQLRNHLKDKNMEEAKKIIESKSNNLTFEFSTSELNNLIKTK